MSTDATNFIRTRIDADREAGRWGSRVATRFPPEPNGYLHIGHVKSICLNFGLAEDYGGTCNLRFDDTNPVTEDPEFVEGILQDIRWLGFEPSAIYHASDYFEQLYQWAEKLVMAGKAYIDDTPVEQMREMRGTVSEPGVPSAGRDRDPAENLDLFRRMRAGEFPDGSLVLRAKIDLANPNMQMRDPLMYRIKHHAHYRTGDAWCIYPMYDWAHGQSDAIEGISHSICTLEFANNRELYDWFTEALELPEPPKQIEFARLALTYTVMSKRFFKRMVAEGRVSGWDDPRMPTIAGLRRRGVTPSSLREFADRIGVAKANSTVDLGLLEWVIRDDLSPQVKRRMAVYDPLKVVITNWQEDHVEFLEGADYPPDVDKPGSRRVPFGKSIWIERSDFSDDPPPGYKRLVPGGEVRLRYGYVIRCDEVVRDDDGAVTALHCHVDLDTLGRAPEGRKVKGVIHWVGAQHALPATIHVYDRLFVTPEPGAGDRDYVDDLNPHSLTVYQGWAEPSVDNDEPGVRYQFERQGYVYRAPEDAEAGLVFNQIVGLKDTYAKDTSASAAPVEVVVDPNANAEAQARIKAEARAAYFGEHPAAQQVFDGLVAAGTGDDEAFTVASDAGLSAFHAAAAAHGSAPGVANWISNVLLAATQGLSVDELAFGGAAFGKLVALVEDGTLSSKLAKDVLGELLASGGDPKAIAEAKGWIQVSDADALEAIVDQVIAGLPDETARYRGGETKLLGFFMGQVMQATKGKANPGVVRGILQGKLG